MKRAAEDTVELNDGDRDIPVALDRSWQKRGHTSNNGIVSATSIDSGKVLDVEVSRTNDTGLKQVSQSSYQGASGRMEVLGALTIFSRSEQIYGVHYGKSLGDGNSKAFLAVKAQKPYRNDVEILGWRFSFNEWECPNWKTKHSWAS